MLEVGGGERQRSESGKGRRGTCLELCERLGEEEERRRVALHLDVRKRRVEAEAQHVVVERDHV